MERGGGAAGVVCSLRRGACWLAPEERPIVRPPAGRPKGGAEAGACGDRRGSAVDGFFLNKAGCKKREGCKGWLSNGGSTLGFFEFFPWMAVKAFPFSKPDMEISFECSVYQNSGAAAGGVFGENRAPRFKTTLN